MASRTVTTVLTLKDRMSDKLKAIEGASGKTAQKMQREFATTGKKISTIGKKVEGAGKKLTTTVTAPIIGAAGAALKVGMDFDAQMSKVSAISGATGEDFDALRQKARDLGSSTKFSATEAAEAMEYMAMAGWKTNDVLAGTEGVMNLAAASGEDLATTSDIVTDAMTAFGLSADQSNHFADVLAAASSNANTNVGMMGETFKYVASVAGGYGYSIEDTAESIGLMANAGIKSSQAGTALRSIMSRLATDAGASSKSLGALGTLTQNLGVQFYNSDGSMREFNDVIKDAREAWQGLNKEEQANYAKKIAGQNAQSGWLALMNASTEDVNKLHTAIDGASDGMGAAAEMAKTMQDNNKGALTILKSGIEEVALSVNDYLAPYARKAIDFVQKLTDKFNGLSKEQKDMIVKIALIAAAVGPVLIVVGKVIGFVGLVVGNIMKIIAVVKKVIMVIKGVAAAIKIVIAFIAANPIVLIIVAIIAVIAVIIRFRKQIAAALKAAAAKVGEFVEGVKQKFGQFAQTIHDKIVTVKGKLSAFKKAIGIIWQGIGDAIKSGVQSAFNWITSKIDAIKNGFATIKEKLPWNKGGGSPDNNATGTSYYKGGRTWVGEHGPELVDLPGGSKVYTNQQSKGMGSSKPIVLNVTIQGNVIGNEVFADQIAERTAGALMMAMAN